MGEINYNKITCKEWKPKSRRKIKISKDRLIEISNECKLGGNPVCDWLIIHNDCADEK